MGNMYGDSILQVNAIVGCEFHCLYCKDSFQKQMKRQKNNCMKCYNYEVHEHLERLDRSYPHTEGDQFIWMCSSCDIAFAKDEWMEEVYNTIREYPDRTFFLQSKYPLVFMGLNLPSNLIIGTTLETNSDTLYKTHHISEAPLPTLRAEHFTQVHHSRKSITIEPILEFELEPFVSMIVECNPTRIYLGYDTKNTGLPEPTYYQFQLLLKTLKERLPECKIKTKFTKKEYWKDQHKLDQWVES